MTDKHGMAEIAVYGSGDRVQLHLGSITVGFQPDDAKWVAEQLIYNAILIEKSDGELPYEIEEEEEEE